MATKLMAMQKLKSYLAALSQHQLIGVLTAIAALIAWRVAYIQQGWINSDTTLYFEQARLFALGDWQAALALFKWPLYAASIAVTHSITGLSIHASAQLLNVIFYAIASYSFSTLIQLAGGNKSTIVCGSALLFSCAYISGSVLGMLLRDEGFWAFFLLSLVWFVRFMRSAQFKEAIFWQLSCMVAMLFRLEAITYLLVLPLVLYIQLPKPIRAQRVMQAYALTLALIILGALALWLSKLQLSTFGRIEEIFIAFFGGEASMYALFVSKSNAMASAVLGNFLSDYAAAGLTLTLLWITIVKCATCAGWLPLALVAARGKEALHLPQADAQRVLIWVAAIAFINGILIVFHSFVLSNRYVIAFGLIMLLFAAFGLATLIAQTQHSPQSKRRLLQAGLGVAFFVICGFFIKNIATKRADYSYDKQAVEWTLQQAPAHSRIHFEGGTMRYYAHMPWAGREDNERLAGLLTDLQTGHQQFDYLVMRVKANKPEKLAKLRALKDYDEIKQFCYKSGNCVAIFKHNHIQHHIE